MTELEQARKEKDEFFHQSHHSPLTPEQQRDFDGLNYFPENPDLRLELEVDAFDEPEQVQIQTNTGEVRIYRRFGRIAFEVEGEPAELTIYEDDDSYFLPFVDSLAGKETYGAGRYLEPHRVPGGKLRVDFNLAYNPYCAYNENWSCPLTPPENRLKVPIRAGEKIYEKADLSQAV